MKVTMKLDEEKKHSVRYDAVEKHAAIKSIYIMKSDLPKPYPKQVQVEVTLG